MVGAADEAGHFIVRADAGREDDDAELMALGAQLGDEVQPAAVGQAEVDDGDDVVVGGEGLPERRDVADGRDRVPERFEELAQFLAQYRFVFDEYKACHEAGNSKTCRDTRSEQI